MATGANSLDTVKLVALRKNVKRVLKKKFCLLVFEVDNNSDKTHHKIDDHTRLENLDIIVQANVFSDKNRKSVIPRCGAMYQ